MRTRGARRSGTRALVILLSAMLMIAAFPLSARAAAFLFPINTQDGSNWSWPGMAQTFDAVGPITGATLRLHKGAADTADFRVEIRTAPADVPSGYQAASSGIVLAAAKVSTSGISTSSAAPTDVPVTFASPAIVPAGVTRLAIVVLRGANSGLAWHASTPDGVDQYATGKGFLCVIGSCWQDYTPAGEVDFVVSIEGTSSLEGSKPRVAIVAPKSPTRSTGGTWKVLFDKPVTGLTAGDFIKSGSADNCALGAPTGSGAVWAIAVTGCTAGTIKLTLKANAVTSTGDPSPVTGPFANTDSAATLRIDRTRPGATTPRATLLAGAPLSGASIPVRLAWTLPADGGGAGVWKYDIYRSTNGGGTWTKLGSGQPTFAAITQPASGTVIYRVRAVDWAGNLGPWTETPTLRPRIVQQSSSAVTYTSGWSTFTDADFSGGTARGSSRDGAAARYTFSGRAIGVVMSTESDQGVAKIYLDGTLVKTVDLSLMGSGDRIIVYAKRFSSYGTHTIRVVSSNAERPQIFLDAFARL